MPPVFVDTGYFLALELIDIESGESEMGNDTLADSHRLFARRENVQTWFVCMGYRGGHACLSGQDHTVRGIFSRSLKLCRCY